MTDHTPSPLSWLQPIPAPRQLPDGYDRYDPKAVDQRAALATVLDGLEVVSVGYRGLVDGLLALGRTDIALARLSEGHVDALRILAQAAREPVPRRLVRGVGIPFAADRLAGGVRAGRSTHRGHAPVCLRRVVVIGSGFIGCEAAASLAVRGADVVLVTGEDIPHLSRLGPDVGRRLAGWLRDAGIELAGAS